MEAFPLVMSFVVLVGLVLLLPMFTPALAALVPSVS